MLKKCISLESFISEFGIFPAKWRTLGVTSVAFYIRDAISLQTQMGLVFGEENLIDDLFFFPEMWKNCGQRMHGAALVEKGLMHKGALYPSKLVYVTFEYQEFKPGQIIKVASDPSTPKEAWGFRRYHSASAQGGVLCVAEGHAYREDMPKNLLVYWPYACSLQE